MPESLPRSSLEHSPIRFTILFLFRTSHFSFSDKQRARISNHAFCTSIDKNASFTYIRRFLHIFLVFSPHSFSSCSTEHRPDILAATLLSDHFERLYTFQCSPWQSSLQQTAPLSAERKDFLLLFRFMLTSTLAVLKPKINTYAQNLHYFASSSLLSNPLFRTFSCSCPIFSIFYLLDILLYKNLDSRLLHPNG